MSKAVDYWRTEGPTFDPEALGQLEAMGFPLIRCQKALIANPGNPEAAVQWLFERMEDPDIDTPLPSSGSKANVNIDPSMTALLQDMGFTEAQAKRALRETVRSLSLTFLPLINIL